MAQKAKVDRLVVPGFQVGVAAAGLKANNALDMSVIVSDRPAVAAGVFTRNRVVGEPVKLDRLHLRRDTHRAVIVNAKVSNVCTGDEGLRNARAMAARVAELAGCATQEVFVASTGVIGRQLPMEKIIPGIDACWKGRSASGWSTASRAIMTTDTRPKMAKRRVKIGDTTVTIGGIAKGSGMIHPNMATMLCFIATDAAIEKKLLQEMLRRVADRSFNRVTVDGDTSTSDTMLVLANGVAGNRKIAKAGQQAAAFEEALTSLAIELAREVARDGEGAQHLVTVNVCGARSNKAAHQIANTIATSPLVKTAIFGRDANWGRIAAAAGRAGIPFRASDLTLHMNGIKIFEKGKPVVFDESVLTKTLAREEIVIDVVIGAGKGEATVWTCDLTDGYIHINADYRS